MKKVFAVCLSVALILSLGVLPISAAAPTLHETFESLVSFENYKCQTAQPNGFAASVIQNEMMEKYAFDLPIEWWGENAPSYAEAAKADFESYVNARYEVSSATWNTIRAETIGYYDREKDDTVTVPFYNAEKQVYIIASPGGYGGGVPQSEYAGYVKNGEFYEVYLQLVDYVEAKPTTGVEGKDWFEEEMYGDTLYKIPSKNYHKYTVTYKNSIMKKYKSTAETTVPANLIKAGAAAPTTTTVATTTTTAAISTTTTAPETTTTVTETEQPLVTLTENATVKLESAADAFPKNTVVSVEEIKETAKLEAVQTAVKDTVKAFVAYEITATSNNISVQPNGKIKATFAIPEGYNTAKVAVFYVSPDGESEAIPSTVDATNGTVIAELSHFSTYIVAEKIVADTVDTTVPAEEDAGSPLGWIIAIVVIVLLLGGVAVWYFVFFRKK